MKKLVIAFLLMLSMSVGVQAQTYYYKYLYTINSDGMKINWKKTDKHLYLTFNNSKSVVYDTNASGISIGGVHYKYQGVYSGLYGYKGLYYTDNSGAGLGASWAIEATWGVPMGVRGEESKIYLFFKSDYSRLNMKVPAAGLTHVFDRKNSPEDEVAPDGLY